MTKIKDSIVIKLIILLLLGIGGGCHLEENYYAPVVDAWRQSSEKQTPHIVEEDETIFSIAWRYDHDYRELARINHIEPPYRLHIGQAIWLVPPHAKRPPKRIRKMTAVQRREAVPIEESSVDTESADVQEGETDSSFQENEGEISWRWPTHGKIISGFSGQHVSSQKGIDIVGEMGQPIQAAAAGTVVYAGHGLKGYGNMIILKHNALYLSAYAHNQRLLVHEGDRVKKGQTIGYMGESESNRVELHFEIRKAGKPTNPLKLLPPKNRS